MSNQQPMDAAPKQQACRYPMCGCVVKLDGSWQGCKAQAPAAAACAQAPSAPETGR